MSIYLLQLVGKWVGILLTMLVSIGRAESFSVSKYTVNNIGEDMNISVVADIDEYETIYKYNYKLPAGISNLITEGQDGIKYIDPITNDEVIFQDTIAEVIELGSGPYGKFTGTLTGYGPDCKGCSKTGTVSCRTREKTNYSLINDGVTYTDTEYGEVHILAAATSKFPCGTIILVDNGVLAPFYGVVMDTGYTMRKAWNERSRVWIDLAFTSQDDVDGRVTSEYTKFEVQRWGW